MNRRRAVATGVGGAVLACGFVLAAIGVGGGGTTKAPHSSLPPATAPIERTTLTETQEADGTLGFGATHVAKGTSGRGTLTWVAAPGYEVTRGRSAYRLDDRPVPLLYGSLPLYRTLGTGTTGADVAQFERNLRALGYTGFTVDKTYSSDTAAAVRHWQGDLGVTQTGRVSAGSVFVAPGPIRVAERKAQAGDRPNGPLFTYTGTSRVVSVALDVKYQRLAKKGAAVSIDLPDGGTTKGTIAKVGKVAKKGQGDNPSTITVTVEVAGQRSLGSYDKAPVTVQLSAGRHPNVLAVPIAALLAQPDGGYAVQVVEGARVRTVAVETGAFTDGKVEISGSGLSEGMQVGVPA
ncbi:peptidoglycan-binding protein [Actinomadura sp. DC4]|uniref:peptidoglycan-binding protein n=1 Tax=Actinomadura sp. DC4 TaxID=3055069 RepID=UPI0025B171EF|nr:peptidoglycan-binding protein [Actinomadura sp. DC4]MDN3352484.1 peptidoglycan-binding protein [Actinomadura sp. DC4]